MGTSTYVLTHSRTSDSVSAEGVHYVVASDCRFSGIIVRDWAYPRFHAGGSHSLEVVPVEIALVYDCGLDWGELKESAYGDGFWIVGVAGDVAGVAGSVGFGGRA